MKLQILSLVLLFAMSSLVFGQQGVPEPSAKHLFDQGVSFLSEGKFEDALAAFRKSALIDPGHAATHSNRGTALLALNRPEESITAFREAIRLAPAEGRHRMGLCTALSLTNRHPEAIKECEEGVRLNPGSAHASHTLMTALKAAGRPSAEIMRLADLATGRFRESVEILTFAAELYSEAGNYVQAAELLKQLIALRPEAAIYHGLLAEAFLKLERDEEALFEARTALKLEPSNPYANYSMGMIFRELGQHEEAAESFGKVQPGIPRLRFAEYYKAISEEGRGRRTEAIKIFESLVSRFPDDYDFQEHLGGMLNNESRYSEAVGPYTKARQLHPKSIEAASGLGLALFESGQFEKAIPVLEDALRISPGNEVVTMFLNVTRARQGLLPQIDERIQYAKENPQDVTIRRTIVQALAFSGRIDEAEPWVKEIYALKPRDLKVYAYIAAAYSTAGKLDKAIEVNLRSLELGEDPGAYGRLASIYASRGDFERAAAGYRKLLELRPDSPDTLSIFGNLLMDNGKRREALDAYKRSLAIKPMNGVAIFRAGVLSAKLGERENALQYLELLRPVRPDLAKMLNRALRLRIWG